jgi:hypothetical protein
MYRLTCDCTAASVTILVVAYVSAQPAKSADDSKSALAVLPIFRCRVEPADPAASTAFPSSAGSSALRRGQSAPASFITLGMGFKTKARCVWGG